MIYESDYTITFLELTSNEDGVSLFGDNIISFSQGEFFFPNKYQYLLSKFFLSLINNKENLRTLLSVDKQTMFDSYLIDWENALKNDWIDSDIEAYFIDLDHWFFYDLFFLSFSSINKTDVFMFYLGYDDTSGTAYHIFDMNIDLKSLSKNELINYIKSTMKTKKY